jgi:hypothetical protein
MAYRAATNAVGGSGTDQVTINTPTVSDGEVLGFLMDSHGETITWGFTPAASGTFTTTGNAASRATTYAWATKVASSEPANRTFIIGGGNGLTAQAVAFSLSGRSTAVPSASTATNDAGAGATPVSTPLGGVTAAASDDIVILTGATSTGTATTPFAFSAPTNYTTRATQEIVGNAFMAAGIAVATRDAVGAGATGTLTGSWSAGSGHFDTSGVVLAFPASGGGSTEATISNASPQASPVTMNGRAATVNSFSTITIREVLVNEAGSPVANRTGISLLVWYAGNPVGAPDLSYSALTTDAAGTASWNIATGGLSYNQTIFYVATDGGASLSQSTCARLVPTYS